MITDLTICVSQLCPLNDECYRHLAKPKEYGQSYGDFSTHVTAGINGYACSEFMQLGHRGWIAIRAELK